MIKNKIIIFDIDGTLVNVDKLLIAREKEISLEISKKYNLKLNKAQELFIKTKNDNLKLNKFSTIDILLKLKFSKEDFYSILNKVEVKNKLKFIENVNEVIKELSKRYIIVALSNTPYIPATNTLKEIGIEQYFDKVYCIDNYNFIKPSTKIYKTIFSDFNIKEGFSIGNSIEKDLIPAKKVKLKTILIDIENKKTINDHIDFKISNYLDLLKIFK